MLFQGKHSAEMFVHENHKKTQVDGVKANAEAEACGHEL